MNDNNTTLTDTLIDTIATKTGIDRESATKVVTWMHTEGVIDYPVAAQNFEGVRE